MAFDTKRTAPARSADARFCLWQGGAACTGFARSDSRGRAIDGRRGQNDSLGQGLPCPRRVLSNAQRGHGKPWPYRVAHEGRWIGKIPTGRRAGTETRPYGVRASSLACMISRSPVGALFHARPGPSYPSRQGLRQSASRPVPSREGAFCQRNTCVSIPVQPKANRAIAPCAGTVVLYPKAHCSPDPRRYNKEDVLSQQAIVRPAPGGGSGARALRAYGRGNYVSPPLPPLPGLRGYMGTRVR